MAEIAPTRSRTDPLASSAEDNTRLRASTQPHHSRLRATSFRRDGSHRHRNLAKETVQSAIELKPPITFEHLLRRDKKDRGDSDSSRRETSNPQGQQQQQLDVAAMFRLSQRKNVTAADVEKARKENELRDEDLRSSLQAVEEAGMSSTRQLDDTYYAILEKASILRSTVTSLQALVDESQKLHSNFQSDTRKLEVDTKNTAQSFQGFKTQEVKINALVSRLEAARGKTDEVSGRLEEARLRVEAYEEGENVKSKRRRTRFNMTGIMLLSVIVMVVAILIVKHRKVVEMQLENVGDAFSDIVGPVEARLRARETEDPFLKRLFDDL